MKEFVLCKECWYNTHRDEGGVNVLRVNVLDPNIRMGSTGLNRSTHGFRMFLTRLNK